LDMRFMMKRKWTVYGWLFFIMHSQIGVQRSTQDVTRSGIHIMTRKSKR
jgi:hypothetical protein